MATRLQFIITHDEASEVRVDYRRDPADGSGLWITQDDDRVWVPTEMVDELRSALYEQKAALEEEQYEGTDGTDDYSWED